MKTQAFDNGVRIWIAWFYLHPRVPSRYPKVGQVAHSISQMEALWLILKVDPEVIQEHRVSSFESATKLEPKALRFDRANHGVSPWRASDAACAPANFLTHALPATVRAGTLRRLNTGSLRLLNQ